jgi:ribose 5-phosphate isomerase B
MNSFDFSLPIAIGSDHAGFELKSRVVEYLKQKGYTVDDKGTYDTSSVDYPDFAHPVADAVETGKAAVGILFCGSAQGVCMTANKHQGIRAALVWQTDIARLSRLHNNANVICIPARYIAFENAKEMIDIFLSTEFEGGRHENRVKKIGCQ